MFRRRFQSGTLGRSVRRFGRFPGMGSGALKRKSFEWKYVSLENSNINRTAGTASTVVLIDNTDWAAGGKGAGVRNVSLDICFGATWSPEVTTLGYGSIALKAGVFARDNDDATTDLDDMFSQQRALIWNAWYRNVAEQPSALGEGQQPRYINWRIRAKQRFLKFDESLQITTAFTNAVDGVIADARLWLFGRISWEAL